MSDLALSGVLLLALVAAFAAGFFSGAAYIDGKWRRRVSDQVHRIPEWLKSELKKAERG